MKRYSNSNISILNILAAAIVICLMAGIIVLLSPDRTFATDVTIGQATNGEGGRISGCTAGDQTGKEVSLSGWSYRSGLSAPNHWVYVFRAKDPEVAKKMAAAMKAAADNACVGYDQKTPDRYSFYDEAQKVGWDIEAIETNCETTCASAVSVCLNAAGVEAPRQWSSGAVYNYLMSTDQFYCYTDSEYTASPDKLLPGDILCNPRTHTAMVVESPNPFLYEVKYSDTSGEEQTDQAEEGSKISLNLNNGKTTRSIKVDSAVDLNEYAPEKQGYEFDGWDKVEDGSYSARYKGTLAPVRTTGNINEGKKQLKD